MYTSGTKDYAYTALKALGLTIAMFVAMGASCLEQETTTNGDGGDGFGPTTIFPTTGDDFYAPTNTTTIVAVDLLFDKIWVATAETEPGGTWEFFRDGTASARFNDFDQYTGSWSYTSNGRMQAIVDHQELAGIYLELDVAIENTGLLIGTVTDPQLTTGPIPYRLEEYR